MSIHNSTVVYDACALYPAPLRSFLMYLCLSGAFNARWSNRIHEEWIKNVLKNRPDLSRQQLYKVRDLMNKHVIEAVVEGFEPLIDDIELPDADDRHVVACAIQAHAQYIVTFNLKDFPVERLSLYGLQAIHPDDFISELFQQLPSKVIEAARLQRASLKNPPFTAEDFLDCLQRQRLPRTVKLLRDYENLI